MGSAIKMPSPHPCIHCIPSRASFTFCDRLVSHASSLFTRLSSPRSSDISVSKWPASSLATDRPSVKFHSMGHRPEQTRARKSEWQRSARGRRDSMKRLHRLQDDHMETATHTEDTQRAAFQLGKCSKPGIGMSCCSTSIFIYQKLGKWARVVAQRDSAHLAQ